MDWRPRVRYDINNATLDFELPQRPWTPVPGAIGGRRIAASGAQATYKVRHDDLVEKRIRFSEEEWPAVRAWLVWAQGPNSFLWFDDQTEISIPETVYLHSPAMGEPIRPERSAEFPLVFELSLTLRLARPIESGAIAASMGAYFEPPSLLYFYLTDGGFYVLRSGGLTGLGLANAHTTSLEAEFRVIQTDSTGDPFERVSGFAVVET